MTDDDGDLFRVRPGPPRSRRGSGKSGGDPRRVRGPAGRASGRFNARGRGAKLMASLPKESGGWKLYESGMRYRSHRVVVKARVVKLNSQRGGREVVTSAKAVGAHLRYLERDGVARDGEKGCVYSGLEDAADGKAAL